MRFSRRDNLRANGGSRQFYRQPNPLDGIGRRELMPNSQSIWVINHNKSRMLGEAFKNLLSSNFHVILCSSVTACPTSIRRSKEPPPLRLPGGREGEIDQRPSNIIAPRLLN